MFKSKVYAPPNSLCTAPSNTCTGPTQKYSHPVTAAQMYGWWTKPEYKHPEKESWVQSERHTTVNSEMTR